MRLVILIAATVLAGCASDPQRASPYYAKCEYEAEKATPSTNNVVADVMRKRDLIDMCIRQKGG